MKRQTSYLVRLAIVVVLVLGGRFFWSRAQRPAHLMDIADELGSIAEFRDPPSPNHAGTRLLVAQDAQNGPGVFLCDLTTGAKKLLFEEKQQDYFVQRFGLLGWSQDDSLFAYYRQSAPKIGAVDIVICDGNSGAVLSRISVSCWLSSFAWLSPSNFVYLNDMQDLFVYERDPRYGWDLAQFRKNVTNGKRFEAQCFTATSTNSVAWLVDGAIWSLDLASDSPVKTWESPTNTLVDFSFSLEIEKYLLNCTNQQGHFLYTFEPTNNSFNRFDQLVCPPQDSIIKVAFVNQGRGYSYLSNHSDMISLFIKTNSSVQAVPLMGQGEIRTYTPGIDRLFIPGSQTNEPRAIWEYTVESGTLQCVVPASSRPIHYSKLVSPTVGVATNGFGNQFSYHFWPPVNVAAGKKYPLILGATPYSWTPYPQAAANLGYYFLTADRPGWGSESAKQWTGEVTALYALVAKNPQIDTNRILLYARSEETGSLSELIEQNPRLWKGAIIFDPGGALPDLSIQQPLDILIVAGEEDTNVVNSVAAYQEKAIGVGRPLTVAIIEHAPHDSFGTMVQTKRLRHLVKFLSEN